MVLDLGLGLYELLRKEKTSPLYDEYHPNKLTHTWRRASGCAARPTPPVKLHPPPPPQPLHATQAREQRLRARTRRSGGAAAAAAATALRRAIARTNGKSVRASRRSRSGRSRSGTRGGRRSARRSVSERSTHRRRTRASLSSAASSQASQPPRGFGQFALGQLASAARLSLGRLACRARADRLASCVRPGWLACCARPASLRSSAGRPPASVHLGQFVSQSCSGWPATPALFSTQASGSSGPRAPSPTPRARRGGRRCSRGSTGTRPRTPSPSNPRRMRSCCVSARGSALCVDTNPVWPARVVRAARAAAWPRLAGAWGSLRRALVLREPAG